MQVIKNTLDLPGGRGGALTGITNEEERGGENVDGYIFTAWSPACIHTTLALHTQRGGEKEPA